MGFLQKYKYLTHQLVSNRGLKPRPSFNCLCKKTFNVCLSSVAPAHMQLSFFLFPMSELKVLLCHV